MEDRMAVAVAAALTTCVSALPASVSSASPVRPGSSAQYVLLQRGDDNEVRQKCADHPGLEPFEFVLPVCDKNSKFIEILGSWSGFQDKHRMKRRGQELCVSLLLPPGTFDFQVYRNGLPASKTMHTLRNCSRASLGFDRSFKRTVLVAAMVLAVACVLSGLVWMLRLPYVTSAVQAETSVEGEAVAETTSLSTEAVLATALHNLKENLPLADMFTAATTVSP